jgi:hypothetical protein
MPSGGTLDFVFNRLDLPPNTSAPVTPAVQACCTGPQITHVIAGELTVRVDGPLRVFRAGESAAGSDGVTVSPDTDVVLDPGDTIVFDFASPTEYTNHGSIPVQLVTAGLYAGTLPGPWADTFTYLDGNENLPHDAFPPGPARVRLIRATLPPEADLPPPSPDSLVLEVGAAGDASIGMGAAGVLRNISPEPQDIYVITIQPTAPGTPVPET